VSHEPIHDQSYRHYEGERRPLGRAWSVIARRDPSSSRADGSAVLLVSVDSVCVAHDPDLRRDACTRRSSDLPVDAHRSCSSSSSRASGCFCHDLRGSGLIANDRRANALQIYLSKPLLRSEYIGGKFAVLARSCCSSRLCRRAAAADAGDVRRQSRFLRANMYGDPGVILAC
jgi:hypothetical protein